MGFPTQILITIFNDDEARHKNKKVTSTGYEMCSGIACIVLHTSCSMPIVLGDSYGNLVVSGWTNNGNLDSQCCNPKLSPISSPVSPPVPVPTTPRAPTKSKTCNNDLLHDCDG